MTDIYEGARALARSLKESEEYSQYKAAREEAFENETTKSLLKQYHQMQLQAQASMLSGSKNEELMQQMQRVGELLQMNPKASAYLTAEYRLSKILGDVYKILGEAIDVDLSALEG